MPSCLLVALGGVHVADVRGKAYSFQPYLHILVGPPLSQPYLLLPIDSPLFGPVHLVDQRIDTITSNFGYAEPSSLLSTNARFRS
jgi:hypothetical protein